MKIIALSRGLAALVDDNDYEFLSKFKWYALKVKHGYYAARTVDRKKKIYMHRELVKASLVDHRDGNGLNNCRGNLRPCTRAQNRQNSAKKRTSKSGFKGVFYRKNTTKNVWNAGIRMKGKDLFLGAFSTKEEAARAYDVAAEKYFGEFAQLNFPWIRGI